MLDTIRKITPLGLRKKVGPLLGYSVYVWRTRLRGRTWEPHVVSPLETIEKISDGNMSAIRFGDGEISLIEGNDLGFQEYDPSLAQKLEEILRERTEKLLICIPGIFGSLAQFPSRGFWFEIHHLFRHGHVWKKLTRRDYTYGDAFFVRPYLTRKDTRQTEDHFKKLKMLWHAKDVLLIEGEKSRLGVGNDLFEDTASIKRILGPAENAYARADAILTEALKHPKNTLVLLSLGPTAKVIAHNLFIRGYRVLDIGHIDMEYEMFLRGNTTITPVPYKYFNEIDERDPASCTDEAYLSQIVAKIL